MIVDFFTGRKRPDDFSLVRNRRSYEIVRSLGHEKRGFVCSSQFLAFSNLCNRLAKNELYVGGVGVGGQS